MASLKAQRFSVPKFMPVTGAAAFIVDKIALAAAPQVADTIDFLLPAGIELAQLEFQVDDLDSNGAPTFAFSVGYRPATTGSTLAASANYFAAAGQVTGRTGGRLRCDFKPITFEEDVIVQLVVGTAAATFQAGEIHCIANGNCTGPK